MAHDMFSSAAPDFSDPLGLLKACHQRILGHCETLIRLSERLAETGADSEVRRAASSVHRYFSTAGRLHHEDEEIDVFPRLSRQSLKLADRVHRLRGEHQRLDELWGMIEPLLADPGKIQDITDFRQKAEAMKAAYESHIEVENSELFEMARHIFGRDTLREIGVAMAERRGVTPSPL